MSIHIFCERFGLVGVGSLSNAHHYLVVTHSSWDTHNVPRPISFLSLNFLFTLFSGYIHLVSAYCLFVRLRSGEIDLNLSQMCAHLIKSR